MTGLVGFVLALAAICLVGVCVVESVYWLIGLNAKLWAVTDAKREAERVARRSERDAMPENGRDAK